MGHDTGKILPQQSPEINFELGVRAKSSTRTVFLSEMPLSVTIKMSSDVFIKDVPIKRMIQ